MERMQIVNSNDEIIYSEPNVWHFGGCATESDYPCDCGAVPTLSDPTRPEVTHGNRTQRNP